jgi:hypothetical protein
MSRFDTLPIEVVRNEIMRANKFGLIGKKIDSIQVVHSTDATAGEPYCIFYFDDKRNATDY